MQRYLSAIRIPCVKAVVFAVFCTVPAAAISQTGAGGRLLDVGRRHLLHETLSGEIAKDHVIEITRHHRIQGSRGYRDAANYVRSQLLGYRFDAADAYIESYPSDGKVTYQTWQSPSGWDVTAAELRMLEPYDERIVGYPEIAMSLMTYSNAGEATAELVWVGSGTRAADYEGRDVRGKMVLATGYGGAVHRLAVLKYGALAVVCYLDDARAQEYPDMLQYTGMWPKSEELAHVTFGFNLTRRQGEKLRKILESGTRVVLQGKVEGTGLEPFFLDVVVAHIRGREPDAGELVFSAHLDHPKESANDNASGSAALLDIARALKQMIDSGRLNRPRRSLRFIWVPEWYGTMAYIDKHEALTGPGLGGRVLANMNLDMVGEHLELLHSRLILTRTPDSMPSVVNDVVADMALMVDDMDIRTPRGSMSAFNYRVTSYSGGSDHMMFIDRKIPGIMFSHSPDYTHHTSEDTPDKVDPVELERCEMIAAAAMLYLSDLTTDEALQLCAAALANAAFRLGEAAERAHPLVRRDSTSSGNSGWFEAANLLDARWSREKQALASILQFNKRDAVSAAVKAAQQELSRQHAHHRKTLQDAASQAGRSLARAQNTMDTRVAFRRTRGPLDFALPESALPAERADWYATTAFTLSGSARFELVNFIDGHRSLTDIRDGLSAQFGPIRQEVVTRYVEDLVTAGVVGWR